MDASLLGQFDLVSQLLDGGEDIHDKDNAGWTAVHYASAAGRTDVVRLLLSRGAYVNSTTSKNESCLLLAMLSGYTNTVRELVSAGADVNIQREDGISALHAASREVYNDLMKKMLDKIPEVTTNDDTSLISEQNKLDKFPLPGNADIDSVEIRNESSLLRHDFKKLVDINLFVRAFKSIKVMHNQAHTKAQKFINTIKIFLRGIHVYCKDNFYDSIPLLCALLSRFNYEDRAHSIMRYLDENSMATDRAADRQDPPEEHAVHSLLPDGADADSENNDGGSLLYKASERKFVNAEIVNLLLDNGSIIENRDKNGYTPLFSAADRGNEDVVQLLLDRGGDVNAVTNKHESCLLITARGGHARIARILLSAGADVNLQNIDG